MYFKELYNLEVKGLQYLKHVVIISNLMLLQILSNTTMLSVWLICCFRHLEPRFRVLRVRTLVHVSDSEDKLTEVEHILLFQSFHPSKCQTCMRV